MDPSPICGDWSRSTTLFGFAVTNCLLFGSLVSSVVLGYESELTAQNNLEFDQTQRGSVEDAFGAKAFTTRRNTASDEETV